VFPNGLRWKAKLTCNVTDTLCGTDFGVDSSNIESYMSACGFGVDV
jgi:hypothetical protein